MSPYRHAGIHSRRLLVDVLATNDNLADQCTFGVTRASFPTLSANLELQAHSEAEGNMTQAPSPAQRRACFLSLPHNFDTVRDALAAAVKRVGGDAYFVIESKGDTLRREIKNGLHASSVLIADLSSATEDPDSKGPRPAIMWEAGYAEAQGLHRIFICQTKDKSTIPALLSDYHTIFYDLQRINQKIPEIEGALQEVMLRSQGPDANVFRSLVYVDRNSADLDSKFLKAKETIKILELNLDTVAEQAPVIIAAIKKNPDLFVQILTLNPFSRFANDRANQLAELPLRYRRQLYNKIKATHDELGKVSKDHWGLKIYDTFPTQIMFQIDDALIHSIISLGKRSRSMLHFQVQSMERNASDTFEAHFAELWAASTEYEEWYKTNEPSVQALFAAGT